MTLAVDSAFLLLCAKRGRHVDATALMTVEERWIEGLGFDPADHLQWSDESGSIVLGAWQRPSARSDESAWHVTNDRVAMAVGHAWWRDGTGRPLRRVTAASLADAGMSDPPADTVEHLRGIFAMLGCSAGGEPAAHRSVDRVSARPERRVDEPSPAAKPEALMAKLQHTAFDDRKQVSLAVLEDRASPLWEMIDREAAIAALERFPALKPKERRELYGAITAALWLAEDDA